MSQSEALVPVMPSHKRALTRSTIGSLLATGSEFINLPILVHLCRVTPEVAFAAVQVVATIITFLLNRYWAFEAKRVGSLGGQTLRYGFVFGGSLLFNTGLSSLLHRGAHLTPVLAFGIAQVIVYVGWNYPMNRYFVFKRPKALAAHATS